MKILGLVIGIAAFLVFLALAFCNTKWAALNEDDLARLRGRGKRRRSRS